jgi:hypothetical protein
MLSLSLTKILFTAALIFGVWKIYRIIEARNKHRVAAEQKASLDAVQRAVEELAECSVCGTYVPSQGANACDRADCPFGA